VWPNITIKREPPPDAKDWGGKPDKIDLFRQIGGAVS
jgi:ferredoxin